MTISVTRLSHRYLIRLEGADKVAFLQGLVTNDVSKIASNELLYAALLTPQGKFLNDLFITETEKGDWLIDCENPSYLIKKLNFFKLRSAVELINLADQYEVYAVWGEGSSSFKKNVEDVLVTDPRLPDLGYRLYHQKGLPINSSLMELEDYDHHRLKLGVADGSRDIPPQKGVILEYNFDELGAINWDKGCYVGQELMARTHYRGAIHKRLLPVKIEGDPPAYGALIFNSLKEEVGELKSTAKGIGIAMLRLSIFQNSSYLVLDCEQSKITPFIPTWLSLHHQ
jgi:folate-binding protein YgfZ